MKLMFLAFLLFVACETMVGCRINTLSNETTINIDKSISRYEELGLRWGKSLQELSPNSIDKDFVNALYKYDTNDRNAIGYFFVNTELKEAFKRGFRMGYQNRVADLVLGPHIKEAAGLVGQTTANDIVTNIDKFDAEWEKTMRKVIDVFIVLISEGSQLDRQYFIDNFTTPYREQYNKISLKYNSKKGNLQQTLGGTVYSLPKALQALDMPDPEVIRTTFYSQAFKVMGDELGRRYGTNLVRRDELVDLLRRSKPALAEGEGPEANLGYIYEKFKSKYGADSADLFKGILKDAGINDNLSSSVLARQ